LRRARGARRPRHRGAHRAAQYLKYERIEVRCDHVSSDSGWNFLSALSRDHWTSLSRALGSA
ncbi:hypothetical protein, partial [Tritonibacter mobilis]|uniref:hypothetical protein n=1 Tax=Tritonibacter mobilis TaxID=379347 RepID=UPI001CD98968